METAGELPFVIGKSRWERQAALPDMWQVVHQCERAGLGTPEPATLVRWFIFLKQHEAATLEEFLQKFAEGAQKRDFYEFSKYCLAHYREVHEKQLAAGMHPIEEALIRERMKGAEEMDQLGDEYHADPGNHYWEESTGVAIPDYRELPQEYVKVREKYASFEDFMADYKRFNGYDEKRSIQDQMRRSIVNKRRNDTTHEIQKSMARGGQS